MNPSIRGHPYASLSPGTWTTIIAAIVTVSSVLGLVDANAYAHETDNWAAQARGQDLGNLVAVVSLAVSCWAYVRGSRAAGAVWLGTLFYLVYAFAIYAVAVHFDRLFPLYVLVLGLSVHAALRHVDELRARTPPSVGATTAAVVLIGTAALFGLLWVSEIAPAVVTGTVPQSLLDAGLVANPVHVLDLAVVLPGFVLTGISLLRGRRDGLFLAGPWLVFSILMGTSVVAATVLLAIDGAGGTLVPMVGVSGVVGVNLVAARRHLRAPTPPFPLVLQGDPDRWRGRGTPR